MLRFARSDSDRNERRLAQRSCRGGGFLLRGLAAAAEGGMIECAHSAEAYSLRTTGLAMEFRHLGDRWQHSVSIQRHGEDQLLLISDEGTPADQVLPSPALQDLRLEK